MRTLDKDWILKLLACEDYRSFLKIFFKSTKSIKNPAGMSFQAFAQRAGYASKSFPAEVLSGKKHIKLQSIDKFLNGMQLNKDLSEVFKNLVMIDLANNGEAGLQPISTLKQKHLKTVERIFKKIQRTEDNNDNSELAKVLLQKNFPEVFAAMGSPSAGARIADICLRTKLTQSEVFKIIIDLQKVNIVYQNADRFYLNTNNLDLKFLNSNQFFIKNFLRSLEKAQKRLPIQMESNKALFTTQTFSVQSHRMPELKKQLEDLIIRFADDSEFADGDTIAEICLSFSAI